MKHGNFVHLHTHSHYSLLDGASKIDDLIAKAKEYKMPALAITDHGNLFGAIEFYKKATKAGVKPIIGIEAYVAGGSRHDKQPSSKHPDGGYHLVLLAKNLTGYKNLVKLSSAAFLEGFYHRPRMDKELLRKYSEGIIATSACLKGEVNWNLLNGDTDGAVMAARELEEIFGKGNFYLELQNHGIDKELLLIPKIEAIARETKIPLVATNDCHYMRQEDYEAHDALICIQTGKFVSDNDRLKYSTDQIYFKSENEMQQVLGDFKEALDNTIEIAEKCNLELELGKLKLPTFPIPTPFVDADAFLEHLCLKGIDERYGKMNNVVSERLKYELGVIRQMGYSGYFLIVKDFCDYARSKKIRVGPGRGSAAGSIVSYVLKITNVCPIHFGLLFERFLNPERISMPDIDIDFSDKGRDEIIRYVIDKYGKDNVSQIITFGTMAARGVVRDVGRVLSMPYAEVDRIAKMIPIAVDMTLEKALKQSKDLAELVKSDKRVEKLLEISRTLEGLARHCSTHAAGVVIAPTALTDYVPLFKGSRDEITTQFDMKMVEEVGLLKMDFLGLRTLSVIDDALRLIAENYPGAQVDIDNLKLDDAEVYKMFAKGNTIGIFQFESAGMRDYLRRLRPENFNDITAMNALYRPGPLDSGMIDIYVECKTGERKKEFLLPELEAILGDTYGVIVFQEQVLKIAHDLAGYSMGRADLLRKAMGKKDAALMAGQKREFLDGCAKNKIAEKAAAQIFEQIETFARYGFNKAHSTCYALIAYQTAWLKTYYPEEFMAGLMSSEMSNTDRIYVLLEECRRLGIEVLPPDVNESGIDFAVTDKKIRFGLQAIKNVGVGPATAVVEERQAGSRYQSLTELASRLPARSLNRRTLESLISAGACDSLKGNRAQKHACVEIALDYAQKISEKKSSHDLFAAPGGEIARVAPDLPELPDWPNSQKLAEEKKVLGFYVSGHPLDKFRDELQSFTSTTIAGLEQLADNREITVGGIISKLSTKLDKRNKNMAFATMEDYSGQVELIIFSSTYESSRSDLKIDKMVLISGRVSTREGESPKVIVSELVPLEKLGERFNCQLVIKIDKNKTDSMISKALSSLEKYSGSVPVILATKENGSEVYIRSKKYSVNVDFELLSNLKELLGDRAAYLRPISKKNITISNS